LRIAFLGCHGQEDDVPVENKPLAVDQQENLEHRREIILVVASTAPVEITVLDTALKWINGPGAALYADDIHVACEQDGLPAPIAANPGNQIPACRLKRDNFSLDSFAVQYAFQLLGQPRFMSGRVAGVDSDQSLERPHSLVASLLEIRGSLRNRSGTELQNEQCERRDR
jgi:hypothetical protein